MSNGCSVARIGDHARAVRTEAERMLAVVGSADETATVQMTVAQFRDLAGMMTQLADAASGCGGSDCMGAPVDGFRFWVAHPSLGTPQGNA